MSWKKQFEKLKFEENNYIYVYMILEIINKTGWDDLRQESDDYLKKLLYHSNKSNSQNTIFFCNLLQDK